MIAGLASHALGMTHLPATPRPPQSFGAISFGPSYLRSRNHCQSRHPVPKSMRLERINSPEMFSWRLANLPERSRTTEKQRLKSKQGRNRIIGTRLTARLGMVRAARRAGINKDLAPK